MRIIVRSIAGPIACGLAALATNYGVQMAWSADGLTGQIRATFFEAAARSCLRAQIDAAANKAIPVSALYDYCKCYSNGMADKLSDDEVRSLEATGDVKKYAEALHDRAVFIIKQCQEATRKSLMNE